MGKISEWLIGSKGGPEIKEQYRFNYEWPIFSGIYSILPVSIEFYNN